MTSGRNQRGKKRTRTGVRGDKWISTIAFHRVGDTTGTGDAMLVLVYGYWCDTNPEKSVWDGVTGFPWQRDGRAGTLSTICIIYWLGGAKCGPCINSFPVKWNKERVASATGIVGGVKELMQGVRESLDCLVPPSIWPNVQIFGFFRGAKSSVAKLP